ncbi:MAG: leucyl aminopeptidase family protein [Pseudomonadota bacterium]
MTLTFADADRTTIPVHAIGSDDLADWRADQPERVSAWIDANGFSGRRGQALVIPDESGALSMALLGTGTEPQRKRGRFVLAEGAAKLPAGTYRIERHSGLDLETEGLGWLLSGYDFARYRKPKPAKARLIAPNGIDAARVEAIAGGEALTRDLINTPASDMGPNALETEAQELAERFNATIKVTVGDALLDDNYPMIHTVGRASTTPPRLIDLTWGDSGPRLTIVGKGVCFDTGGLNLKPGGAMGLMKKDMGGAATVLGLAHMIMALGLPVQLRVLIPAVENAVSGNAFRPGDILTSRKGLTVEINNTDAEGRLVLADALALADDEKPDLMVSMATLTGAARVAVGPDLAPFYCNSDDTAAALTAAGSRVADPVWRMPFHDPYEAMIEPGIADLDNAPSGGFAGSITAALFLRRFVTRTPNYLHFDIYGWQPSAAPARPKGGVGQGARALLDALPDMLNL